MHDLVTAFNVTVWSVLLVVAGVMAFRVVRWVRATPQQRRVLRLARRVRRTWAHLAVNVGLSYTDTTTRYRYDRHGGRLSPVTRYPTIRVHRTAYGVDIDAGTVPGVGLVEYTKAAGYLADAWGCTAVQVRQTGPGGVRLRALLTDPLLTPLAFDARPEAVALDVLRLEVDEYGQQAGIPIPETSGLTLGGLPGYGKTSLVGYAFVQLAPSPLVQFAVLDGKGGADYGDIARRAFLVCGDDLGEANKALARLHDLVCSRQGLIKQARGWANFWRTGPDAQWPLVVVIVDESHTFGREYVGVAVACLPGRPGFTRIRTPTCPRRSSPPPPPTPRTWPATPPTCSPASPPTACKPGSAAEPTPCPAPQPRGLA